MTVVQGDRLPAALDARHLEVDPAGTPRSHGGSRLTGEENGCGGKRLLEAPIVDPWVTMRSSILSVVASVVAGMELMVHLGMRRLGGDTVGAKPALLHACRTMRASLGAEWWSGVHVRACTL